MKNITGRILIAAVFVLLAGNSAWAIIDKVEFRNLTFPTGATVNMPQSCSDCQLKVFGGGTDLATEITVSGTDAVTVGRITERKI